MINQPDDEILASYLSGECSHEEKKIIEAWLQTDPQNNRTVELMKTAWNYQTSQRSDWHTNQLWQTILIKSGISDKPISKTRFIPFK